MTAVASPPVWSIYPARTLGRLRNLLLWMTAFSGAFVFMEPSPYEIFALLTMFVFFASGLSLAREHLPLIFILILYCFGLTIALIPVIGEKNAALWVGVSWFLAATTIFFACVIAEDTGRRLSLILSGYQAAAVIASLIAIGAYFRLLPGADAFLLFGRAKATFNDPNVLGPFLVLPALIAIHRALTGRFRDVVIGGAQVGIMSIAVLLSFSRAAWGHYAFSAILFVGLLFVVSNSTRQRTRIVAAALAGALLLALALLALLSIQGVGALFQERATLDQSYDTGQLGRFGRHVLGMQLALERPLGLGPFQFAKIYPEDPHNVYLNAFMTGGWLGGTMYLLFVLLTLTIGFRAALRPVPWRPALLAIWATFFVAAIEGLVIDSDHWRHFWLLAGLLWGGAVANRRGGIAPTQPPPADFVPAPALRPYRRITIVRAASERGAARLAH
jgi:hypothetical protein